MVKHIQVTLVKQWLGGVQGWGGLAMRQEKQTVKQFYDVFGWNKNQDGVYEDTATFVDTRPVLDNYHHKVHMRVKEFINPQGEYFLDAGSGAISHPEHIEYSAGYKRRVCVDLSAKALSEARSRLKEQGSYILADLTRLPFRDRTFDTTVCAHVLYHIPEDEQALTIIELHRTLKQGGNCVIVYNWSAGLFATLPFLFSRQWIAARVRRLISTVPGTRSFFTKLLKPSRRIASQEKQEWSDPPPLYFHAHDYQWFQEAFPHDWETDIRCWRSVGKAFTTKFVGNGFAGRFFLELLFRLESTFPHTMARLGQYPMMLISK